MKYVEIRELGEIITGKTPPTENQFFYDGDYPFITPTDIESFDKKYLCSTERTLSSLGAKKVKSCKLPAKSICFVCIGSTIGKMCMTNCESYTNQQINSVIPNKRCDNDYLFYYLRYVNEYFRSIGAGTGSGKGIVNKTVFSKTKIQINEDKKEQKKIADVLSTYDELIENNNKRIKILEQMAENLYKEWFVRFRFPGHESVEFENAIPKGWESVSLSELLLDSFNGGWGTDVAEAKNVYEGYVIRGTDIPDIKNADMKNLPLRYHTENHIITKQLIKDDIIIELSNGNIDNIGRSLLITNGLIEKLGKVMCASFCKTLRCKNHRFALSLFFQINYMQKVGLLNFYKNTGTNGINNFNFKRFLKQKIICPKEELLISLEKIYELVEKYRNLNENLSNQRGMLLPRLMSGKLEVGEKQEKGLEFKPKKTFVEFKNEFKAAARKDGGLTEQDLEELYKAYCDDSLDE